MRHYNFWVITIRLSTEIAAVEVTIPEVTRFREGHTQVTDVRRIYLTGSYKDKYNNLSYKSPLKSLNNNNGGYDSPVKKPHPDLEIGFRKVKSAYPNVRGLRINTTPSHHYHNENCRLMYSSRPALSTAPPSRGHSVASETRAATKTPIKKCLEKCFKYKS